MPKTTRQIKAKPKVTQLTQAQQRALKHREVEQFLAGSGRVKSSSAYVKELIGEEAVAVAKKRSRRVSTAHARDLLYAQHFVNIARPIFEGKITPTGYAQRHVEKLAKRQGQNPERIKRHVTLMLSDLHIGAKMPLDENPYEFNFLIAGRRIASLLRQVLSYKQQYRAHTQLNLVFNGDLIEGRLGHDEDEGEPLPLQKVAALHFFSRFLAEVASAFPFVRVYWQSGNHGRDVGRHPKRALNAKWNGHEGEIGMVLRMMTARLPNVGWHFDRRAWSIVSLPGERFALATHGDTELQIPSPGRNLAGVRKALMHVNGTRMYHSKPIDVLMFGHYHEPALISVADKQWAISNGALIPSNGFARSINATSPCMQALFESVADHPVGDFRWLSVGRADDEDASLDALIVPFVSPI